MAAFEDSLPTPAWGSRYLQLQTPNQVGTDVKVFQTLFNLFLQYSAPPRGPLGTPISADGVFGVSSSRAVHQWQQYFGLQDDGVIGPVTGATFGQYNSAYGGPRFGSRFITTLGMSGGDVTVLQNRLNNYRYFTYVGHPANGTFDASTLNAVQHFQQDMNTLGIDVGVPTDGTVKVETFDALWAYTYLGGRGLWQGRNGIDTLWLQRFLKAQGLYSGPLDGYFSAAVTGAVVAFQTAQGITADGQVGQVTMYHIGQVFNQPAGTWP